MAVKTGGRDFKPGQSGNPKGRPKDPPELKAIKQMTKAEFSLAIQKLINLKPDELKEFKGTAIEMALAATIQNAIKYGDVSRIQSLIDRLFGKVTDKLETTGKDGKDLQPGVVIVLPAKET